jgi:hypothetical protein
MKKKKLFIGIDFSKLTFDVTYFEAIEPDKKHYKKFDNTEEGFCDMIKWI